LSYIEDDINNAIDEYQHDMATHGKASCLYISEKYGVPRSTLYRRVSGKVEGRGHKAGGAKKKEIECKCVFGP
jgi:hypothetical protein